MKRIRIDIDDIAAYDNIIKAFYNVGFFSSRVKKCFPKSEIGEYKIQDIQNAILKLEVPIGKYRNFLIRDPKLREIHAPSLEDRVIHHAIINKIGSVLQRGMVDKTYACIKNRGTHKAVEEVQRNIRRYPWFVKIDIRKYFDSIDHQILKDLFKRRFKGKDFLQLLFLIIDSYGKKPAKGLPIGALTSQYFANYYLDGLDRFVMGKMKAWGYTRYMDDVIWFCSSREVAKDQIVEVKNCLKKIRKLDLNKNSIVSRSKTGVTFCGYRIYPGTIRLTMRKKRNYLKNTRKWKRKFQDGEIDALKLQQAYESCLAPLLIADTKNWRQRNYTSLYFDELKY